MAFRLLSELSSRCSACMWSLSGTVSGLKWNLSCLCPNSLQKLRCVQVHHLMDVRTDLRCCVRQMTVLAAGRPGG